MKYSTINEEESIIYPTFRDERIQSCIKEDYNISNYTNILSKIIDNVNNIKEIILLLLNKNLQNENEFIKFTSEYNIDIKSFLIHLFYLKRRINLFYDLQVKKETINDYINNNKNPLLLHKLMEEENNILIKENNIDNNYNEIFNELYREEKKILDKISMLNDDYIPNIKSFCIGLYVLHIHLNDAYIIFKSILNSPSISDVEKEKQLLLCKLLYKIQSCGLLVFNLYFLGKDNIFNENEKGDDWLNVINDKMKRILASNKKDINDTIDEIKNNLSVAFCSMNQLEKYLSNNFFLDNSIKGVLMAFNYIMKKNAKYEADKFLINPDIKICQKIWGLTETKESKKLIKIVLPHIEYRETFYITRNNNDIINEEIIDELTNIINDNNFHVKTTNINKDLNKKKEEEQNNKIIFENENNRFVQKSDRFKSKKELKSINKKTKKLNYIKIILIHNSLITTSISEDNNVCLCCNCGNQFHKNITKNSIIVHVHGGGFITLSPLSHENYTRKIVNKTGIPLLSIDYRLSPEYSFPSALDDVYQTYKWLIENGENDLNIKINNIILLGDSAGGNLIMSLIYILLIKEMKLPDMIILAYPAVKMTIIPLSLSYLNSLYDPLLDYNLLNFCLKSYLGEYKNDKNPFLSPLYMKNEIIKNIPKINIYGGTADPLRDDYVEFFHKCNKANVDCHLIEFSYFPHGFLNYDYSFIMPQASKCTEMICDDINNYINGI